MWFKILRKKFLRLKLFRMLIPNKYALADTYLKNTIQHLVDKYEITTIVETGVYEGKSTLEFSKIVKKVIGIELSSKYISEVTKKIRKHNIQNVELIKSNSTNALSEIMPNLDVDKKLFFLDAHWNDYWPILDEIDAFEKNKGIIVIHDFKVPNCDHLGYDKYKGQSLDYDYVKNNLNNWSPNHKIFYNEKAEIELRGVAFILNGNNI